MQVIESPSFAFDLTSLPADSALRHRQLQRFVDLQASSEAAAALDAAAARTAGDDGLVARVIRAAAAVLAGDASEMKSLRDLSASREFFALVPDLVRDLRLVAAAQPDCGACTVASALELWAWTARKGVAEGAGPIAELAETLTLLLAARALARDVAIEPEASALRADLSFVYAARAASQTGVTCSELVFGYRQHARWDSAGCESCFGTTELDELEAIMPGIAGVAGNDVIAADGSTPAKRGPCVRFDGLDTYTRLRNKLDGCLTGSRIAKDRAAGALSNATTKQGRA